MQIATEPGQYENTAVVQAADETGQGVTASDRSNHLVNPLQLEQYVSIPLRPPARIYARSTASRWD